MAWLFTAIIESNVYVVARIQDIYVCSGTRFQARHLHRVQVLDRACLTYHFRFFRSLNT